MWMPEWKTKDTLSDYETFHRFRESLAAGGGGTTNADNGPHGDIEPKDVDKLAEEFNLILRRYSTPESSGPEDERELPEDACICIRRLAFESAFYGENPVFAELTAMALGSDRTEDMLGLGLKKDEKRGALSRLFRKTITTTDNLEMLIHMADADFRTGNARIFALHFLKDLSSDASVWKIEMDDGLPFSVRLIRAVAKGLHDHATTADHEKKNALGSSSFETSLRIFWKLLNTAIVANADKSAQIIESVSEFDWVSIFRNPEIPLGLFINLHQLALMSLSSDPDNTETRAFLPKLGSCHAVLCRVLKDVVGGKGLGSDADVRCAVNIMNCFNCCLTAVPSDRKTEKLVHQAHKALKRNQRRPQMRAAPALNNQCDQYDVAVSNFSPGGWKVLKNESDEDRWKRFCHDYVSHNEGKQKAAMDQTRATRKVARNQLKGKFSTADMCANCFVPEKDLPPAGDGSAEKLLRCCKCKQISYCSKECQVAHWHSAHKKQCKEQTFCRG